MPTTEPTHPPFYRDPIFRRLLRQVFAHRLHLVIAVFAMAIAAGTEYLIARLTGQFVDRGIIERQEAAGMWLPFAFVGVFLVRGVAGFASTFLLNRISQAVLVELRTAMVDKLLTWPQKAFEDTPSGLVISKFINEASNALNLAAEVMTTAVRDSLTVGVLLGVLLYYNWQLTLVTLVVAPLIAVALRAFSGRLRRLSIANQEMLGELTRAVQEGHEGSRVIKVYGGQQQEHERFAHINGKLRRFPLKMQVAWSAATPVTQVIAAIGLAFVFGVALWQARTQHLSAGDFVTFLTAALMLLGPLRHLAGLNGPLARMLAGGESVFALIPPPSARGTGTRQTTRAVGNVRFRDVGFAYPGAAAPALASVNLDVRAGELIALVGPSGAGKTTLINLIPRFIDPTAGVIELDGIPIREL